MVPPPLVGLVGVVYFLVRDRHFLFLSLFFGDELRELTRFIQDSRSVASVRVVVLQQHCDHARGELVRLRCEGVTEALLLIVA